MAEVAFSSIAPRRKVVYCGQCGMPPEYCEYGPDFETHCDKWLQANHPELRAELWERRQASAPAIADKATSEAAAAKPPKPSAPWTTEQRLTEFYKKYAPDKMDGIPELLEKYAGKEDKLFLALVKKYGDEPHDPYYSDSSDDEDDDDSDDEDGDDQEADDQAPTLDAAAKKLRRGAGAKKATKSALKIVIQKIAQKKKKNLTIIKGMENVEGHKLKDISKAFSKRFAGSSSVKEDASGNKEIILQGDHMYDVAEMVIDKFGVPESAVYLDLDGDIVPFK
jgi:density-regulated protein